MNSLSKLNEKALPIGKNYFKSQIYARFLKEPESCQHLLLMIPGGPGLSGTYLDDFLSKLELPSRWNVCIFDLPNHGKSNPAPEHHPIRYQTALSLLEKGIQECTFQVLDWLLLGHSLGGRLALDLLGQLEKSPIGVIASGMPSSWKSSKALSEKIKTLKLNEEIRTDQDFLKMWKALIPSYFLKAPASTEVNLLSSDIRWTGNENFLDGCPSLEETSTRIQAAAGKIPLFFTQGDSDIVVPDQNISTLKHHFPRADFEEIPECGHFPNFECPELFSRSIKSFIDSAGNVA